MASIKLKEIQLNQEDSKMRLRNRSKELALPFEPWPVDQRPCAVPMEPRHLCQAINMHTRSMPQLINVDTQLAHQPIGMHTHSKPDDARIQPNSACYVSHPHTWRIFYSKENSSLSQGWSTPQDWWPTKLKCFKPCNLNTMVAKKCKKCSQQF